MSLIKSSFYYTLGNLLPKFATFFLLPVYTKTLGAEEYGISESMFILTSILSVFFTLGISRGLFRLTYDYEDQSKLFGTATIAVIGFSAISILLIIIFQEYFGLIFKSIAFSPYYIYAIIIVFLTSATEIGRTFLMIKQRSLDFVLIGVSQFVISTLFIVIFIIVFKRGAQGMLEGQILGILFTCPYIINLSRKHFDFHFDRRIFKDLMAFSLPAIPTLLAVWILNLSDRVFIERYLSLSDVGIYSLGYKIAGIVSIFFVSFQTAYFPYFFSTANTEDDNGNNQFRLKQINYVYLIVLIYVTFTVSFFAPEILFLFFPREFASAAGVLIIVCYVNYFTNVGSILAKYLMQSKQIKEGMYIDIAIMLLNILFNFLLIPIWGFIGAAIATLISVIISTVIYYLFSSKYSFFISLSLKTNCLLLILSVIVLVVFNLYFREITTALIIFKSLFLLIVTVILVRSLDRIVDFNKVIQSFLSSKK